MAVHASRIQYKKKKKYLQSCGCNELMAIFFFQVYQDTPLIHRQVTTYTIEGLKPNSTYKVNLLLIPFPGQSTELQSERSLEVRTTSDNGEALCGY